MFPSEANSSTDARKPIRPGWRIIRFLLRPSQLAVAPAPLLHRIRWRRFTTIGVPVFFTCAYALAAWAAFGFSFAYFSNQSAAMS